MYFGITFYGESKSEVHFFCETYLKFWHWQTDSEDRKTYTIKWFLGKDIQAFPISAQNRVNILLFPTQNFELCYSVRPRSEITKLLTEIIGPIFWVWKIDPLIYLEFCLECKNLLSLLFGCLLRELQIHVRISCKRRGEKRLEEWKGYFGSLRLSWICFFFLIFHSCLRACR